MNTLRPVDDHTQNYFNHYLDIIENHLTADVLTIFSPISAGLENIVRTAIELIRNKKNRIAIVLDTTGGYVEIVERMVFIIRKYYQEVHFIVPDRAMSAGTVFVMAGDQIYMTYSACLGPIDPQVEKYGRFIPAKSYLNMYDRLYQKAEKGQLNSAELVLLNNLDPGELYQFELADKLSRKLLTDWLSAYKFKDWIDKSTGEPVSSEVKETRAEEIALALSDHEFWASHARMIDRDTLTDPTGQINLKIQKIEEDRELTFALDAYTRLIKDYMFREQLNLFVHTRDYREIQ